MCFYCIFITCAKCLIACIAEREMCVCIASQTEIGTEQMGKKEFEKNNSNGNKIVDGNCWIILEADTLGIDKHQTSR